MRVLAAILLVLSAAMSAPVQANPQLAAVKGARANMEVLSPQRVRGKGFDYDHEIVVALPATYRTQPNRHYPVLWILDGPLMTRSAVGILDMLVIGNHAPEMIVIGVGSPAEEGLAGVGRRIVEFSPPGKGYAPPGLGGDAWRKVAPMPDFPHRADDFLSFLVDQLRPSLAAKYRFSGEHALLGHSAGGMFGAYALFTRPAAFAKMILGSPYVGGVEGAVFRAEERFAASGRDLPVRLFVGAGGAETDEWFLAASNIVSSTARFAETLRLRRYPSLRLTTRFYSGEDHYTVVPRVIGEGIRHLWKEEATALGSSWPQPPED